MIPTFQALGSIVSTRLLIAKSSGNVFALTVSFAVMGQTLELFIPNPTPEQQKQWEGADQLATWKVEGKLGQFMNSMKLIPLKLTKA